MNRAQITLQDDGKLLIPVSVDRAPFLQLRTLQLGQIKLYAKKEHHLTIFGKAHAPLIQTACEEDPTLAMDINDLVDSVDWSVQFNQFKFIHLRRVRGTEALDTIINLVECPALGSFLRACSKLIRNKAASDYVLRMADKDQPAALVPHVTLFTSDPKGNARGIGVTCLEELQHAYGGQTSSFQAWRLCPHVF